MNSETELLIVFSGETQVVSLESGYACNPDLLAILSPIDCANDSSLIPNIHNALIPPTTEELNIAHPRTHLFVVGDPDFWLCQCRDAEDYRNRCRAFRRRAQSDFLL